MVGSVQSGLNALATLAQTPSLLAGVRAEAARDRLDTAQAKVEALALLTPLGQGPGRAGSAALLKEVERASRALARAAPDLGLRPTAAARFLGPIALDARAALIRAESLFDRSFENGPSFIEDAPVRRARGGVRELLLVQGRLASPAVTPSISLVV